MKVTLKPSLFNEKLHFSEGFNLKVKVLEIYLCQENLRFSVKMFTKVKVFNPIATWVADFGQFKSAQNPKSGIFDFSLPVLFPTKIGFLWLYRRVSRS